MHLLKVLFLFLYTTSTQLLCHGAKCEGSVTFYWTEKGDDRIENMRNYGLLEEKLEDRFYKELTDYFNPKNVYAYTTIQK